MQCVVWTNRVEIMQQHSLQSHITSTPLQTKLVSERSNTVCSDLKAAKCVMVPINVKTEPDLDHFLSVELEPIQPYDHNVNFDLLDLKSEIKSEMSSDEHLSFEVAAMIVDPFRDCVKPENEQVENCSIPEHSESPGGDKLQHPTPQAKEDCCSSEVLVLTEPEDLNQQGRVCHLLRYRTYVNKRLVQQQENEKETCTDAKDSSKSCSRCDNVLVNCSCGQAHRQTHTGKKLYMCPTCGMEFAFKCRLKTHTSIHAGEQKSSQPRFTCSQCDKTFAYSSGLRVHMRVHTGERPYQCHTCGKDFPRSDYLAIHMKFHKMARTGERPFQCDLCGKKLTSRGFLQLHKERLHGSLKTERGPREREFSCGSCGKAFMTKRCLISHEATHTDWRPYMCTLCGHSFRRSDSLTKHMRIHSGERPYGCGHCGKTFPYAESLNRHLNLHKKAVDS